MFFVHLCQKKHYDLSHINDTKDTFLEGVMAGFLESESVNENQNNYVNLSFNIQMQPDKTISLGDGNEITSFEILV